MLLISRYKIRINRYNSILVYILKIIKEINKIDKIQRKKDFNNSKRN